MDTGTRHGQHQRRPGTSFFVVPNGVHNPVNPGFEKRICGAALQESISRRHAMLQVSPGCQDHVRYAVRRFVQKFPIEDPLGAFVVEHAVFAARMHPAWKALNLRGAEIDYRIHPYEL